jgi:hypothetical protein
MTLQMHAHAHAVRSRLPLWYLALKYLPCRGRTQLVPTTRARSSVVHAATILPRPAASVFKAPVLLLRRRVHVSSASPFELLGLPCSATPASRSNRPTAARRCSCTQTCIQGMLQRWRTLGCCRTLAGRAPASARHGAHGYRSRLCERAGLSAADPHADRLGCARRRCTKRPSSAPWKRSKDEERSRRRF